MSSRWTVYIRFVLIRFASLSPEKQGHSRMARTWSNQVRHANWSTPHSVHCTAMADLPNVFRGAAASDGECADASPSNTPGPKFWRYGGLSAGHNSERRYKIAPTTGRQDKNVGQLLQRALDLGSMAERLRGVTARTSSQLSQPASWSRPIQANCDSWLCRFGAHRRRVEWILRFETGRSLA
jgi:hypothetical protein